MIRNIIAACGWAILATMLWASMQPDVDAMAPKVYPPGLAAPPIAEAPMRRLTPPGPMRQQ